MNSSRDRFSNIFSSTISTSNTSSSCFSKTCSTFSSSFSNTFRIYMLRRQFVLSRVGITASSVSNSQVVEHEWFINVLMRFISSVPVRSVTVDFSILSVMSTVIYFPFSVAVRSLLFYNRFLSFCWRLDSLFSLKIDKKLDFSFTWKLMSPPNWNDAAL